MSQSDRLHQIFPSGDFAWAFRMRKADPAEFFATQNHAGDLIRQRCSILDRDSDPYLAISKNLTPIMHELHASLEKWGCDLKGPKDLPSIARRIEPDLIVMDQATQKMVAAAVCFPSSWGPAKWLDHSVHEIHAVVPQLNAQIGKMIHKFLTELKPGKAFQRANWSFTRSGELNYHPDLKHPVIDESVEMNEVHLRIEHQLFTAIKGAVVMGIRIQPIPLTSLREDEVLWQNLIQILETMPEDVARYKSHISTAQGKQPLVELMRSI